MTLAPVLSQLWRGNGPYAVPEQRRALEAALLAEVPEQLRAVAAVRGNPPPTEGAPMVVDAVLHRTEALFDGSGDWDNPAAPDPAAIRAQVCAELDDLLRGTAAPAELVVPVERCGSELTGPVELAPTVRLVPLRAHAVTRLLAATTTTFAPPTASEALDWDLAVVIDTSCGELGPPQDAYDLADDAITALRLLRHSTVTARHYLTRPRGISLTVRASAYHAEAKTYGPSLHITAADIEALRGLVAAPASTRDGRLALAARRLRSADSRSDHGDRLVDYWIGLEALYAPDSVTELSYRASLRLAYALEDDPARRMATFEAARNSYKLRSHLVHGNPKGPARVKRPVADEAEEWLRRSLIHYWSSRVGPTVKKLDAPILSDTP